MAHRRHSLHLFVNDAKAVHEFCAFGQDGVVQGDHSLYRELFHNGILAEMAAPMERHFLRRWSTLRRPESEIKAVFTEALHDAFDCGAQPTDLSIASDRRHCPA